MDEPLMYNTSNDVNDAVVEHYLNQPVIVKMDEQKSVNDTSCQHEELIQTLPTLLVTLFTTGARTKSVVLDST